MANHVQIFKNLPIFRNVPEEALSELARTCRNFGKGEMIYLRGQTEGRTFLLVSGEVKLYQSADGQKVVLQVLKAGEFFGDLSFAGHPVDFPSENYAQAAAASTACVTNPADLGKLMAKFPVLAMALLVVLRNRLHQTESKVKDLALSSAQTRIINELIRHAARHSKVVNGGYEIEDKLTHQQLGEMTGLTRETVTKTLNFLVEEGFISYLPGRTLRLNRDKILNDCMDCIQLAKAM